MTSTAFDAAQFSDGYPLGIQHNWWCVARNRIIRSELAAGIPMSAQILEIGCGPGMVVSYLRPRGRNIVGCDLGAPRPIDRAAPHVHLGTATEALPHDLRMSIDCILLLDVIEHVAHPSDFLTQCLAACPNAKTVMITVPARPEAWSVHDEYYGHFRRYTPETLTRDIEASGLRIERVRYFFHAIYLAAMAINTLGLKREVERYAPPLSLHWVHRVIAAAINGEYHLLHRTPLPGLSLLAIARR